jgi:pilus assembly protein CpaB
MKWTILGLVLVGIIAAMAAALLTVTLQAKGGSGDIDLGNQEIEVLVAARDLPANLQIDSTCVATTKAARKHLPEKTFKYPSEVIGQILISEIKQGQVLSEKVFAGADSSLPIVTSLKRNERAMGVMLTSESGIEDMLYPGCVVDIVASIRVPVTRDGANSVDEFISTTPLQNIQVLAVGKRTVLDKDASNGSSDSKRGRMVTVKVSPEEAQTLQLAATQGTITVAMRNPLDTQSDLAIKATRLGDFSEEIRRRYSLLEEKDRSRTLPLEPPHFDGTGRSNGNGTPENPAKSDPQPSDERWSVTVLKGAAIERINLPWPSEVARSKN